MPVTPLLFPAWESAPDERAAHDDVYGDRLRTLKQIETWQRLPRTEARAAGPAGTSSTPVLEHVIVASVQSLVQPVPDRQEIEQSTRRLVVGETLDTQQLLEWLVRNHFHATTAVQLPGEFASRGGILDLFAADWDAPIRVELFGDEIASLRRFDVASQRSITSLDQVEITVLLPRSGGQTSLMQHLPPQAWFLLVEPEQITSEADRYYQRLESTDEILDSRQFWQAVGQFAWAGAGVITSSTDHAVCHLPVESVERFSGEIGKVRNELDRAGQQHEVYLFANTEAELQRLGEIFASTQLMQTGHLHRMVGRLNHGFRLVYERIILISSCELFQRSELRRTSHRRLGKVIDSFLDLREGDLVVHLAHGIGRYRGIQMIDKQGHAEEHLQIEFHGGTKIYVPAMRIGLVQKYVGGAKSRPPLARIGSKSWVRQRAAAEAAVSDMAAEMLEMQAERRMRPGIAFSEDSPWQQEFDTSFPTRKRTTNWLRSPRSSPICDNRVPWTACCAETSASEKPNWRCGPRSKRSTTAIRSLSWFPPRFWPNSITVRSNSGWPSSHSILRG